MKTKIWNGFIWFWYAVLPVFFFWLMELLEHNPFADVRGNACIYNIVLFELILWLLVAVTGSGKAAVRILGVLTLGFGLTNHYVMVFRSTPFVPWDLLSVRTAASVVGNYDFTPNARMVGIVVGMLVLMIAVPPIRLSVRDQNAQACLRWRMVVLRLVLAIGICTGLVTFAGKLQDRQFQVRHGLYPHLFTPAYMTKVNGMAVTFVMDLAYMDLNKPEGYSKAEARALLTEYADAKADGAKPEDAKAATSGAQSELPNIIVIMDEAFSDIGVLGDFEASEDYMPFVHLLQQGAENTVTGDLYVSVCGGNTADTEFEFLTGNTMAFLPAGSVPYQQYIHGEIPSLARQLHMSGYDTYAMHPYYASGWNRNQVYPNMGFDHMLFQNDMRGLGYLRTYASDASDFDNILYLLQQKASGTPAFIFNVTMQNHGSYTDVYENFTPHITVDGVESVPLEQYLSLIQETDTQLQVLLTKLKQWDEKTIVVFFGDHQPNDSVTRWISEDRSQSDSDYYYADSADAMAQNTENLRYKVPYVIWANYDIEKANDWDMSVNYLAANMLRIAGVPTTEYQNFLLNLQKDFPVISSVYTQVAAQDDARKKWQNYQMLQYYEMFDWEDTAR